MSTTIRPELSINNKYWIERHRYYELKHFCLQYPIWEKAYQSIDGLPERSLESVATTNYHLSKPVESYVEKRMYYSERMDLIKQVAMSTSPDLWGYIFKGVTTGVSYDYLKARLEIPCCKDTYYDLYRRFFWLLDKARK